MLRFKFIGLIVFSLTFGYRDIPDIVTKVGTAAAPWLKIETGIRAVGMSGAHTAAGRGLSSVTYNPASLGYIEGQEIVFNKTNYLAGISHNIIGYAKKISSTDIVGFHAFYLDSGEMIRRTVENHNAGFFRVYNVALRGTYTKIFTDRLKVGFSLKYIREDIWTTYMQAVAVDIGSNFNTGVYGFILGMSVSNFGPDVKFSGPGLIAESSDEGDDYEGKTEFYPLPLTFRLGVENQIVGASTDAIVLSDTHSLTLALDGIKPLDYSVYAAFGAEYSWNKLAFVRLGTHFNHDTAGLSFGLGVNYMGLKFDYALTQYGDLGNTGQFGIEWEIGQ